ncbi:MAG: DMT family transporter [Desulfonatronovibrionaceae bacterium]
MKTPWLAVTGLVVTMFLWGSSFAAFKVAYIAYTPLCAMFLRMVWASLAFGLVWSRVKQAGYRRGDWKWLFLMAFFEPCLYFVFEGYALDLTTASQAGMISAVFPLLVVVLAKSVLGEQLSKRSIAGFALAIAGVVWISLESRSSATAPNPALGNFLEFLAMLCAAGYTIVARKLSSSYHPLFLASVQSVIGAAFFGVLFFLSSETFPTEFSWPATLSVVYLGVIVTLFGYTFFNYGVSKIPAGQASVFINLIPVFAVLLGWLLLGETFTQKQFLGAGLVLVGVICSQRGSASRSDRSRPV